MMKIPDPRRGVIRRLRVLRLPPILVLTAATGQRAEALSLINPGAAPAAKYASDGLTTEVKADAAAMAAVFVAVAVAAFAVAAAFTAAVSAAAARPSMAAAFAAAAWRSAAAVFAPARPSIRGGGYRYGAPGIVRHHHFAPRRAYFGIIATISARATTAMRRYYYPRYYLPAPVLPDRLDLLRPAQDLPLSPVAQPLALSPSLAGLLVSFDPLAEMNQAPDRAPDLHLLR